MKKIWTFLIGFLFLFALIACTPPNGTDNDDDDDDNGNQTEEATASIAGAANVTITAGDSFDPLEGVTATDEVDGDITASIDVEGAVLTNTPGNYEITYKVTGSDGKEVTVVRQVTVLEGSNQEPPTEVVIMHGAVYEIDPFHDDYTGREQLNRQQKQQEVEDRLNVRVVYKQYPESAAWGPDRVTAINNAAIAGQPLADIYWTTSDWIQQLVEGNSVVAVDNYIKDGIGTNISAEAKEIGTFRNKVYAFMAGKTTVDTGLYFNSALITELWLEDTT